MPHNFAILDDDENNGQQSLHHGADISFTVPYSEGLEREAIENMLDSKELPIVSSWPKRDIQGESWLPTLNKRSAPIGDIYTKLKPRQIGHVIIHDVVKVNESWVLHGKIHYTGGDGVNYLILKPFELRVLTFDQVRGNGASGRVLYKISKVVTGPR